jgi:uncharacterized protein (TIGR02145 family)
MDPKTTLPIEQVILEAEQKVEKQREEFEKRIEEAKKNTSYFTDSRDGQKYRTVKLGGKTWMAENLNYKTEKSLCYRDDDSICAKYGRLYDWKTAKTACPRGWHLPSRKEWGELAKTADGTGMYGDRGTAGKKLKSTSGWNNNGNGTDEFGFSALPGGNRYSNQSIGAESGGRWWTATDGGSGRAYDRNMDANYNIVGENASDVGFAFSVRCVAD